MAEQPAIDPRYDPAFQRGYDGSRAARPDASHRGTPQVTSALQPPAPAATGRAAEEHAHAAGASATPGARGTPGDPGGVGAPAKSAATVNQAAAPPLRPPWTNPFTVLVTVIGIAVLGTGVWILQETLALAQDELRITSQSMYWFLQWGIIASPLVLGLGVAILVAVLIMCAGYWSRRPDPASPQHAPTE